MDDDEIMQEFGASKDHVPMIRALLFVNTPLFAALRRRLLTVDQIYCLIVEAQDIAAEESRRGSTDAVSALFEESK